MSNTIRNASEIMNEAAAGNTAVITNQYTTAEQNTIKFQPKDDETYIPESPNIQERIKLDMEPSKSDDDFHRSTFVRLCKGNYSRKVNAIYVIRTNSDELRLNWHEVREGRSSMGKKLDPRTVDNMGIKKVPIPKEEIVTDLENEEYNVIQVPTNNFEEEYFFPFTNKALTELLRDADKYNAKYYIGQQGKDPFVVKRDDINPAMNMKDFEKLYNQKVALRSKSK